MPEHGSFRISILLRGDGWLVNHAAPPTWLWVDIDCPANGIEHEAWRTIVVQRSPT